MKGLSDALSSEVGVAVQGIIALASVSAVIYLSIIGQTVPDALSGVAFTAVGFYFGTKVTR